MKVKFCFVDCEVIEKLCTKNGLLVTHYKIFLISAMLGRNETCNKNISKINANIVSSSKKIMYRSLF